MLKEKALLKDSLVKKLFTSGSEASKEYVLSIISEVIQIPKKKLKEDFELIYPEINTNKDYIGSKVDMAYENKDNYFSIEINYNNYKEVTGKNFSYLCQLYLRQIKHKKDYSKLKQLWQINVDNYDYYGDKRFVYISEMLERKSHKPRNVGIHIVDINLDYLEKKEYNEIEKGDILEKLLYIFVCDNEKKLDSIYKGDKLMEEIRKEVKRFNLPGDEVLYYDKEAFDRRAIRWEGRMSDAKKMLDLGMDEELIKEITDLEDNEFEQLKREIKSGDASWYDSKRPSKEEMEYFYKKEDAKELFKLGADINFVKKLTGLDDKTLKNIKEIVDYNRENYY